MSSLSTENAAVLARHVAAETAFDMEATLATLAEDCVFEDVPSGQLFNGREEVRRYYREWWDAFGNRPSRSKLFVVDPSTLIVETHFVGTHRGNYRGIAPSGHDIDLRLTIFVSFDKGLMTGERFYYDRQTLTDQLQGQ